MIYCIWYPSGGFGHYVDAVISTYGNNFVRPRNSITFSNIGDSHLIKASVPKYYKDQDAYDYNFDPLKNYSVLIDNGITNEGTKFLNFFPDAKIIKICYSDFSWPVVANTLFTKALESNISNELQLDQNAWPNCSNWALREKYFLFLRDNHLRHAWRSDSISTPLMIEDLLDYDTMRKAIGIKLANFEEVWQQWWDVNRVYFQPVLTAQNILQGNFEPVSDIWTQAVVYYQIWCKYGIEVPHNDYSNWFNSYNDIVTILNNHGVVA